MSARDCGGAERGLQHPPSVHLLPPQETLLSLMQISVSSLWHASQALDNKIIGYPKNNNLIWYVEIKRPLCCISNLEDLMTNQRISGAFGASRAWLP